MVIRIDITIIKRNIGKRCELFLKNNLKYTGHISNVIGNTVLFIDKFNNEISIDSSLILLINPLGDTNGY